MSNRCHRAVINNSDSLPVVSGIPQGSILGPLLFIIYINDIASIVHHSLVLKFADDTKCFKHINGCSDQQVKLQDDINTLTDWSIISDLKFDSSKSVHLSFKSRIITSYTMFDNPISSTDPHKDLGLVLSTDLSWTKHYSFITARAYRILGLIRRIFYKLYSPSIALKLYTSLVRSQLSYCTQLWCPHLLKIF